MKFKFYSVFILFFSIFVFLISTYANPIIVHFDELKSAFRGVSFYENLINISCETFPDLSEKECNLNKIYVFYVKDKELLVEQLDYIKLYRNGNREFDYSNYFTYSFQFVAINREIIYYNESSYIFIYYGNETPIIINSEIINESFLIKKLEPGDKVELVEKNLTFFREKPKEEPIQIKPTVSIAYKNLDDVMGYGVNVYLNVTNNNIPNTYSVILRCFSQNIECNEIKDTFQLGIFQTKNKNYLIVPKIVEKNITYSPKTLSDKILFFLLKDSIKNYKNYENVKIEVIIEAENFSERKVIETDYLLAYYRPIIYYNYLVLFLFILFILLIIDSFIRYRKYQKGTENE
ncbi:MAG: hypothetical protein QXS41_00515 [Candidatus Woesearchaeota archaeon]